MKARCQDTLREARCRLPADHDGMHRSGVRTWGFRDLLPEWRRRSEAAYRERGRVAVKELTS